MKFYTKYDPPFSPAFETTGITRTKQSHKDECDINKIVKSYERAGMSPFKIPTIDMEGTPVEIGPLDYHQAMQIMVESQERFNELASPIRKRFQHDPSQLLAFLQEPANREEAVKLGIINKPPVEMVEPAPEPTP